MTTSASGASLFFDFKIDIQPVATATHTFGVVRDVTDHLLRDASDLMATAKGMDKLGQMIRGCLKIARYAELLFLQSIEKGIGTFRSLLAISRNFGHALWVLKGDFVGKPIMAVATRVAFVGADVCGGARKLAGLGLLSLDKAAAMVGRVPLVGTALKGLGAAAAERYFALAGFLLTAKTAWDVMTESKGLLIARADAAGLVKSQTGKAMLRRAGRLSDAEVSYLEAHIREQQMLTFLEAGLKLAIITFASNIFATVGFAVLEIGCGWAGSQKILSANA